MTSYEIEDDVLDNLQEFAIANSIYRAMSEGQAAEISARRTAMENATKNACILFFSMPHDAQEYSE